MICRLFMLHISAHDCNLNIRKRLMTLVADSGVFVRIHYRQEYSLKSSLLLFRQVVVMYVDHVTV